ncbi:hypothetical protein RDI58_024689 [Solanum bulbocastanum]|uniref:Uncharacterized protein n=1 Tax=Solanum bulbocastanum TaxID=147425 RepID=A0AAN8Y3W1_SOLBU
MEGGINITNLSDRDSVDRLLRLDNQNRGNPPNYNVNRIDPIEWTSMILSSHDDLSEQYLPHFNFDFDFDYHEGDNMDGQKKEDAMEYFKGRIHHAVVPKDGINNSMEAEEILYHMSRGS